MPPPVGASGMLYRTVIALAAAGRVNSTCSPGSRRTAVRPDASAGSVYAVRSGPITSPFVAAFSASCSRNVTSAPRPATRAGSSAARVTTGAGAAGAAEAAAGTARAAPARIATAAVATRAGCAARALAGREGGGKGLVGRVIVDSFPLGGARHRTPRARRGPRVRRLYVSGPRRHKGMRGNVNEMSRSCEDERKRAQVLTARARSLRTPRHRSGRPAARRARGEVPLQLKGSFRLTGSGSQWPTASSSSPIDPLSRCASTASSRTSPRR